MFKRMWESSAGPKRAGRVVFKLLSPPSSFLYGVCSVNIDITCIIWYYKSSAAHPWQTFGTTRPKEENALLQCSTLIKAVRNGPSL